MSQAHKHNDPIHSLSSHVDQWSQEHTLYGLAYAFCNLLQVRSRWPLRLLYPYGFTFSGYRVESFVFWDCVGCLETETLAPIPQPQLHRTRL